VSSPPRSRIHYDLWKDLEPIFRGAKAPPKLTVSQWSDQFRYLAAELGAESGRWKTGTAEYQREVMDALTDDRIHQITIMKAARTGGTVAAIDNPVGYFIDQDPGPMLVIQTTKDDAKEWSKDHFDTMVRDTPCLAEKIPQTKSKDSNILYKRFPGGILYVIGSNSAAGFRRKTIQRVFLDDVDGYEPTAGREGDQVTLAWKRTTTYTYHHRKMVLVSSPTTRGLSRIEQEYFASDQRHFYVPCPECRHMQLLIFSPESQFASLATSFLKFDTERLSWVYYECENCKAQIGEKSKIAMIAAGAWKALKPEIVGHAGFHFSELTSPFSSWLDIAKDFVKAKRSREALRVFVNQTLGETFVEEKTYEIDEGSLLARLEPYTVVPRKALVLTAFVDVQPDRLECIVVGWGKDQENWFIDRRIIIGSPERDGTWEELDRHLAKEWPAEEGPPLKPWSVNGLNCVCIDSGYSAENVYAYVKPRQSRRYFATKGDSGFKKPFIIDVKYEKKHNTRFALIAVDAIKGRIYDRLNLEAKPDQPLPPGYMHFNTHCNQDFFDQLTSEKRVQRRDPQGFIRWAWVLKGGRRNEVLDCYVGNFAAITLLDPDFAVLEDRYQERLEQWSVSQAPKGVNDAPDDDTPKPPAGPPKFKSNFGSSF